jgi:hypothetical protein|nr:MAG TPA: hypothetical protein [Caudoviricetes sp.]
MINLIHGVLADEDFNFIHQVKHGKTPIHVRLLRDRSEIYNRYPLLQFDFTAGKRIDAVHIELSDEESSNRALTKIIDAPTWYMAHYYTTETIKLFDVLYELEDIIKDNLRNVTSILAFPADFFILHDKIKEIRQHYQNNLNYPFAEGILTLLEKRIKDELTPAWSALQYAVGRVPRDYPVEVDGFKMNCRWIDQCKNTKYPGILVETCFLPNEYCQPEKVDLLISASDKDGKLHYYFDFDEVGYRSWFFGNSAGNMLDAKIRNQLDTALQDTPHGISTGMLLELFFDITYQNGTLINPICTFDELDPTTNLSLWLYRFYELTTKQNPDALS